VKSKPNHALTIYALQFHSNKRVEQHKFYNVMPSHSYSHSLSLLLSYSLFSTNRPSTVSVHFLNYEKRNVCRIFDPLPSFVSIFLRFLRAFKLNSKNIHMV